jgi:hypothetical protein
MTTIFQLNGYYWVAAETLDDATACYIQAFGVDDIDDPCALDDSDLDVLEVGDSEGEYGERGNLYTFRKMLELKLLAETPPFVFACTEF